MKTNPSRPILVVVAVLAACWAAFHFSSPTPSGAFDVSVLRAIPIQSQGRVKPLDTFARETVYTITGTERFEGHNPLVLLLTWMGDPKGTERADVLDCSRLDVKKALGIASTVRHTSIDVLAANSRYAAAASDIARKSQNGEELSSLEKQEALLIERVGLLQDVCSGEAWTIVPDPTHLTGAWVSLARLSRGNSPVSPALARPITNDFAAVIQAVEKNDGASFLDHSRALATDLSKVATVASPVLIARELDYNDLAPFEKAWWLYLAALLVLVAANALNNRILYWCGYAFACGGLIIHVYGFYLRCTIAGRPPVTNMYESVVWVSFGAMFFALVMEAVFQSRTILMAACTVSTICLILADNTASVLDPAINPLTPVLRNNFWLTIHVLTITLSYAAFLLSTAIGHASLWGYAFHPEDRERQRTLHGQLYKSVQIGVMLLAAGTILGGVWANYSWGRFWGWDPKEVWALIALLGYLAVLHGRYAGWLRDFGLAAGVVIAYMGVLMAWYGVNFVLGAGMHSYGFGQGGQQYVATAVALDVVFVALMTARYKAWCRRRSSPASAS